MADLIQVSAEGIITGDYWDNLCEFEHRARSDYAELQDLKRKVEFEGNAARMQSDQDQRKEGKRDKAY